MKEIGYVRSDYGSKFGIPRQSGLADTEAEIVLLPPYHVPEAVRGLEEFSHIWVLWKFSENIDPGREWSPTVRPPRLGGNQRKGVFATRSPFRPNPIGLSCVRLINITREKGGTVLHISGEDMMNGTPVYDIKPYLVFSDSVPQAKCGFSDLFRDDGLEVEIPEDILCKIPKEKQKAVRQILAQDPRPSYQEDPEREYGMNYGGMEIKFKVKGKSLKVTRID